MISPSETLVIFEKLSKELIIYAMTFTNNKFFAEEAVQDVIANILENKPEFSDKAHCVNYLYKSVKNMAINAIKREQRTITVVPEQFYDIEDENKNDFQTLEWLRKALRQYPEKIAEAYIRKVVYLERMSELAAELDMKSNTLTSYFKRIDHKVKEYYSMFVDFVLFLLSRLTFWFF